MTLSPTTQSWPTWDVAMNMPSICRRVSPRPGLDRADMHGHVFADLVAVADNQLGRLALIGGVVRRAAEGREKSRTVQSSPIASVPLDNHVECRIWVRAPIRACSPMIE